MNPCMKKLSQNVTITYLHNDFNRLFVLVNWDDEGLILISDQVLLEVSDGFW